MLLRTLVAALATTGVLRAQQASQQPAPVTERVEVTRVVIDARVIDEAGAPVTGLAASDFVVTIGGKPARVQMALWTGDQPSSKTIDAPPLPTAPRAIASEPGQLVVLFFQKSLVNERAWGLVKLVDQSRELVSGLPASSRVAVVQFEHSVRIYSDFTDDRRLIDRILEHGLLHEPPPRDVAHGQPSLLDVLTPDHRRKTSTMAQAFSLIAEALRPMPGSKAIVYIGYGMGTAPFRSRMSIAAVDSYSGIIPNDLAGKSEMNNEYTKARRALNEARATVFSLDITKADSHGLAAGMQTIAADTGGFYAHSLDFPEKPMHFVEGALLGHYVLFIEPPNDSADRTMAVSVTADRRAYVYATSSYPSSGR